MIPAVLAAAVVVGMVSIVALAENDGILGNGAPQAKLLGTLNIIGVANPKTDNMDDKSGNTIFVNLDGKSKIFLANSQELVGEDVFQVLDKNGTDADGAKFMLPPPDLDPYNTGDPGTADTDSAYSVFVRPLGKPGGWATITTCAELVQSNLVSSGLLSGTFVRTLNKVCYEGEPALASVEQVGADILTRTTGQSKFTNVTAELLTIVLKVEVTLSSGATLVEYIRVPIFDDIIQGEYWDYEDHGLRLCQVRFYDVPTDVSEHDGTWNNE
jgi:hypothetical protein